LRDVLALRRPAAARARRIAELTRERDVLLDRLAAV